MPIYIYRGGGQGSPGRGPNNPIFQIIISALVLAAMVGLGVALLPVLGVFLLVILGLLAVLVIGGLIYRWIYGDPWERIIKKSQEMQFEQQQEYSENGTTTVERFRTTSKWKSKKGDIEDAVIVDERKKSDN